MTKEHYLTTQQFLHALKENLEAKLTKQSFLIV